MSVASLISRCNVYMFGLVRLGVNIPAAVRQSSTVTCHKCHMEGQPGLVSTNQMRYLLHQASDS